MGKPFLWTAIVMAMMVGICPAPALAQAAPVDQAARCQALATADFSNIPDAPTQITEARLVKDAADLVGDMGGLRKFLPDDKLKHIFGTIQPTCRVAGYVTPSVGFVLLLPVSNWNGKFLHRGCGGWCGTTLFGTIACALNPGYACITTDMGHTGRGGLWVRNNLQAQIDFSYRATHVATVAGKAIVEHYYSAAARKSYFVGCSTGGYQGMVEAQRYPWDFDGIVAGAPDMDESDLAVRGTWLKRNFLNKDGKPVLSAADIALLHQAALDKCDMDDGVRDGIISAPHGCRFDPAALLCKAGEKNRCLTASQVEAVRNIYGPPRTSKGLAISSRGVFPGSERDWPEAFPQNWGDMFFKDTALLTPGKAWDYRDFDFDRDYRRSGTGALFEDTNPDLRRFRDAGGKLLSYQGGNDTTEYPGAIFDYYDTVEKTMGGRAATQDFFRLFTIPGMRHCTGGDGAFAVDYLHYLEAWVERGAAPDKMIAAHVSGLSGPTSGMLKMPLAAGTPVTFTRPVYPYPLHAKYKGSGDSNDAANFEPAE